MSLPIPARKAVVGRVYLTPKGKEVRVESIGSHQVMIFRVGPGDTVAIDPEYQLTPKEELAVVASSAPAQPPLLTPAVEAVVGQSRDVLQPWIQGRVPPPPTDADFDALIAHDSRAWVSFEVDLERERRALAAQAQASAEPVAVVAVEGAERASIVAVEPMAELIESAPVAADMFVSETAPAPVSDALPPAGEDPVATDPENTTADDLPWGDRPSVLPGETPAPKAELTPAEARAVGEDPVVEVAPAEEAPAAVEVVPEVQPSTPATPAENPERPPKERPKGYCPACAQLLTVRAEGGMMQHFTPDGRKGPDGKRVSCQGVGLAPRSEPAPIERLPLSEAMGVAPAEVPLVVPVELPPIDVPPPTYTPLKVAHRYTLGGSEAYGWCVMDVTTGRALGDMGHDGAGIPRLYGDEAEAWQAVYYVREHGELPDGGGEVVAEAAAGVSAGAMADLTERLREAAGSVASWPDGPATDYPHPGELPAAEPAGPLPWPAEPEPAPAAPVFCPPLPAAAPNPIEALSEMVAEAKARGVRVRIIIEPIE